MAKENNTKKYNRRFLVRGLPDSILPSDSHLQIYDRYLGAGDLSLYSTRVPERDSRERFLKKRKVVDLGVHRLVEVSQIEITHEEFDRLKSLAIGEVRKNRYFSIIGSINFAFDIYLGKLWGLCIANVGFEDLDSRKAFVEPEFSILDISNDDFFDLKNLVNISFPGIQEHVRKEKADD